MTALRLQFDLDSEVYPELHALLSSIAHDAAREERLRQLASIGLLWERLRMQALGQMPLPVPDLAAAGAVPHQTAPSPSAQAAVEAPHDVMAAADAAPAEIDAEPGTLLALRLVGPNAPAMFVREMQSAVDQLPVLTEVVDPAEFLLLTAPARAPEPRPEAPARPADTPRSAKAGTRSRLVRMKEKGLFRNE